MKGNEKKKVCFSEMAASPQSGTASDQKRKKSLKESETKMIGTDSESEFSDTYTKKEIYSESDEYKDPQKDTEKVKCHQKQDSIMKQHSINEKAAKLDSDDDKSQPWQPKRLKMVHDTESYPASRSYESKSEIPESKKLKHFPTKIIQHHNPMPAEKSSRNLILK